MALLHDKLIPKEIRSFTLDQLQQLAQEVRATLIETITQEGGHFGGNLGVVELTIALHAVYNTPDDKIIIDIGHQGYPHKMITGRSGKLATIRKTKGLSPFLKRSESEFDHFGAGHTATSLSAAQGIAEAFKIKGIDRQVVALIGDGAITGGLPFEAMNNIGEQRSNVTIAFNDNTMSIDPNCGALCAHFADLKQQKAHQNIFECFGIKYLGPVDGHNLEELLKAFNEAKTLPGPKVVHVITEKGHGYEGAKDDRLKAHAISHKKPGEPMAFNKVFGDELVKLGESFSNLVAITPAMASGSSMLEFAEAFPDRFYDVAIAEQHAVTFSAGLATEGLIPFCTIYSTFLQRGYDQIIHDVCIQNLPVRFMIDRAGLVGADGPTHHGAFDIAYLRPIPNMVIAVPRDEAMLRKMMQLAASYNDSPIAVRYPRGAGIGETLIPTEHLHLGKAEELLAGNDAVLVGVGPWLYDALEVAKRLKDEDGIDLRIVDLRFVKPLDESLLASLKDIPHWFTLEDHSIKGGVYSAIAEWMKESQVNASLTPFGLPDAFVEHGSVGDLRKEIGCDKESLYTKIRSILQHD